MVKRYEIIEVPASTEKRVMRTNCDKCDVDITEGMWEYRDLEISFLVGSNYGIDGGDLRGWEVEDLCDTCASNLRKLLDDNGYKTVDKRKEW